MADSGASTHRYPLRSRDKDKKAAKRGTSRDTTTSGSKEVETTAPNGSEKIGNTVTDGSEKTELVDGRKESGPTVIDGGRKTGSTMPDVSTKAGSTVLETRETGHTMTDGGKKTERTVIDGSAKAGTTVPDGSKKIGHTMTDGGKKTEHTVPDGSTKIMSTEIDGSKKPGRTTTNGNVDAKSTTLRYIPPPLRASVTGKGKATTRHSDDYVPPPPPPTRPAASNQPFNADAANFAPQQQPLQSVSAIEPNKKYRTDKHSRYGPQQPTVFGAAPIDWQAASSLPAKGTPEYYLAIGMPTLADQARKARQPKAEQRWQPAVNAQNAHMNVTSLPNPTAATFALPIRISQTPLKSPHLRLLKRPEPSRTYLAQANMQSYQMANPQPLLVVLDLNGTLLHRHTHNRTNFVLRPRVPEFLHYLLTTHKVMVWSSARLDNVKSMCSRLFTHAQAAGLVAIWARDRLGLTPAQYREKVQVYKQLSWIWSDPVVQSSAPDSLPEMRGLFEWGQENTVLIDDSVEKAASEPYNLVQIDEFEGRAEQMQVDVLGQVVGYLETLRTEGDVSGYMRCKPFVYDPAAAAFDWMPIFNRMH